MDLEKVDWDKLSKTRLVIIRYKPTYEEKQLPDGVFACPHCKGEEKVVIGHSFRDGELFTECKMCKGIGEIRKCSECNTNPVPNDKVFILNNNYSRCSSCYDKYKRKLKEDFNKRIRESQLEEADV